MYYNIYLFICFAVLFSVNLHTKAQFYIDNEAIYNEAEEYLVGEEYEEALPLYLMLEKKGLINSNISYKIGICYLNISGEKLRSIRYLEKAVENITEQYTNSFSEKKAPLKALVSLGQAYHLNYKFDSAKQSFKKFQLETNDSNLYRLADYYISCTDKAKLLTNNQTKADIQLIETNSNFPIYNPARTGSDEFVLMEKRKFYDAIVFGKVSEDSISEFENLTPEIGSDGNLILQGASANGKTLIFSGYDAGYGYELYYSELQEDGRWSKYKKFAAPINSVFNETSAYLTDENELYFTSNRTGGIGGSDIYISQMNSDGTWGKPINLGIAVNTTFNEYAPVLSNEGLKLFFSSEGHLNIGGYDFFYSEKKDNKWLNAVNLGSPISTPGDDLYLWETKAESIFYTTSFNYNQNESGKLYKIVLTDKLPKKRVIVNGSLNFPDTLKPRRVKVKIQNVKDDSGVQLTETSQSGDYSIVLTSGTYDISFNCSDQIHAKEQVNISDNPLIDVYNLAPPAWEIIGKDIGQKTETIDITSEYSIYVQDILFGFNSSKLNSKYHAMLDSIAQILNDNSLIRLVITGYTDNIGGDAYNMQLSGERAKTVADYVLSSDISVEQILFKGKGESNPVAMNFTDNGTDNPEGRRFNRRVTLELKGVNDRYKIIYLQIVPNYLKIK